MCVYLHCLFICACVCVCCKRVAMRKEGQREISYCYHIHQTQGQLVYRNSLCLFLSLAAPCHPHFIRVSREACAPEPLSISGFCPITLSLASISPTVFVCVHKKNVYVLQYLNILFGLNLISFNHWLLTFKLLFIQNQLWWVTEVKPLYSLQISFVAIVTMTRTNITNGDFHIAADMTLFKVPINA